MSLDNLGLVLGMQGRFDEALPLHQRALAMIVRSLGPDHPEVAASRSTLANLCLNNGRYKQAAAELSTAIAEAEKTLGPDHHDLTFYLSGLGKSLLGMKKPREAIPVFEQSLKLRGQADPADTADVRFMLGQAMWDAKLDRRKARELAESARDAYKAANPPDVEEWLASHKLAK